MRRRDWSDDVRDALAEVELPEYASLKFVVDLDPDGNEVGLVWIEMPDREDLWTPANRAAIRQQVSDAVDRAAVGPWVAIYFTESGAAPAEAKLLAKAG